MRTPFRPARRLVSAVLAVSVFLFADLARAQDTQLPFGAVLKQAEEKSRLRDWPEAAKLWERVTTANPVNGRYWESYATALLSAKEYRQAIPAYRKALDLRAGFPFNQAYNIACAYARLGEKSEALTWLEKSFDMGFRDLAEMRLDPDLESLREEPRFKVLAGVVDTGKMSRDEGWRFDLALLARELKRKHYELSKPNRRQEVDDYARKLDAQIPSLSDEQVMIGFMKLTRLAGDGHTSIWPAAHTGAPIQLYLFEDGLFITATTAEHADLLGAQVIKVGETPAADALKAVEPIVPRDNDMGIKAIGPGLLRAPRLLYGLGLIPSASELPLTIRDTGGTERSVKLTGMAGRPDDTWSTVTKSATGTVPLYMKNRTAPYWFEHVPDRKLVYFQYNAVRNDAKEPLEAFCDRLFKFVDQNDIERLVVDLRWNGGGNTFLNKPIIHGIIRNDKINRKGKLFVIIGRQTFSAAQNCATFLERHTNAIFVGEPSGSSPNFVGETVRVSLPYSKMQGSISDLYWQSSWPMDYRTWIAPSLYAPPTFAAFKARRDPALEAVLAYTE